MYYRVHDEEQWKPLCNGTQLQTAVQYFGQDTIDEATQNFINMS